MPFIIRNSEFITALKPRRQPLEFGAQKGAKVQDFPDGTLLKKSGHHQPCSKSHQEHHCVDHLCSSFDLTKQLNSLSSAPFAWRSSAAPLSRGRLRLPELAVNLHSAEPLFDIGWIVSAAVRAARVPAAKQLGEIVRSIEMEIDGKLREQPDRHAEMKTCVEQLADSEIGR